MADETPTLKECTDPFPETPLTDKYRYFNQPIEQIPGYEEGKTQMLFHKEGALVWQSIPETCVEVVKCVKLEAASENPESGEGYTINMEQKRIRPLQDLGDIPGDGSVTDVCEKIPTEGIDVVTCIALVGSEIQITRRKVFVLKSGEAGTGCLNIETVECPATSG